MIRKPSIELNNMLVKFQYFILLSIYYGIFVMGCVAMTPFAYLRALSSKFYILSQKSNTNKALAYNISALLFYLFFGIPM